MELALRAGPDLVSPNAAEAEGLVGHEFRDAQEHVQALHELCELGAREAIITHADGCYAIVGRGHERRLFDVTTEPLEPVSAIGAGDVFLAGYLAARYGEQPYEECLRFGVACGAESTQHFGAGIARPARGRAHRERGHRDRARAAGRRARLARRSASGPGALQPFCLFAVFIEART